MMKESDKLLDYQKLAIDRVRQYSDKTKENNIIYVEEICNSFNIDITELTTIVLSNFITINFHIDRFSKNGKIIIDNLIEEGKYHSQFHTGTTNGYKNTFIGGKRFLWEQSIFFNAYPEYSIDRPKYGSLNLFKYIDGAAARFGSCYFTLKHTAIDRCTFAYGDSSNNPSTLCTKDNFINIIALLSNEAQSKGFM
ncbi:MAG: DUF3626 domain-containing protein [Peptostreptococcaceae bacterium]